MKRRLALIGSIAAALTLGMVFSGCGSSDESVEDIDIAGRYTFQVSGNACYLEFRSNGKYYYTGLTQGVDKEGDYSVSGDEVSMSYTVEQANATTTERFTAARNSDGDVTLELKGGTEISVILSSFNLLAKEITLIDVTQGRETLGKYSFAVEDKAHTITFYKDKYIGYSFNFDNKHTIEGNSLGACSFSRDYYGNQGVRLHYGGVGATPVRSDRFEYINRRAAHTNH
jgi:hypothetical protein